MVEIIPHELPPEGERLKRGFRPGTRRRTRLEIQRDRSLIERLRLLNRKSHSEIAAIISAQYLEEIADQDTGLNAEGKKPPHVGKKQVAKELEATLEDYKESRADEIHAKRTELIRRYEYIGGYAAAEYEASKAPKVISTTETTQHPEHGEITKEREVTEPRVVGDKGFLNIALECANRIAELEAAIPPRKTALTNPDGTEPMKFEGLEELKRLSALAEELLHPTGKLSDV